MIAHIRTFVVAAMLATLTAAPAAAQDVVAVAYQYFNYSAGGLGNHMPFGIAADYAHTIKKSPWSVIGSVDWSRDSEESSLAIGGRTLFESRATLNVTAVSGGARWTGGGEAPVFLQVLLGVAVSRVTIEQTVGESGSDSSSDFMYQIGAGFALPITDGLGFVGQLDFRDIAGAGRDGLRLAGGVRIKVR